MGNGVHFNELFGDIDWRDADRLHKLITKDIPVSVAADTSYQNAKENSDTQNARIECDKALSRVITGLLQDDTELFKQFMDNDSFRHWLQQTVFNLTYTNDEAAYMPCAKIHFLTPHKSLTYPPGPPHQTPA